MSMCKLKPEYDHETGYEDGLLQGRKSSLTKYKSRSKSQGFHSKTNHIYQCIHDTCQVQSECDNIEDAPSLLITPSEDELPEIDH